MSAPEQELKFGPFVLWHRLTRGHWFVPLSDLVSDYCRTCLKNAMPSAAAPEQTP